MAGKPKKSAVHVLCGLPGSGKSTFAALLKGVRVDFDSLGQQLYRELPESSGPERLEMALEKALLSAKEQVDLVLDGLFTNERQYEAIVTFLAKHAADRRIVLHFWEEDRDACLWNDRGRRDLGAEPTIRHLPLEKPDIVALIRLGDVVLEQHQVVRKPDAEAALTGPRAEKES